MSEAPPQAAEQAGKFGEITLDMLKATFDHWRIFEKDGRFWAMRSGAVTADGPESLIRPFAWSLTTEGLGELLSLQEHLRRMSAAELEAVWRERLPAAAP
jgi:hypothetical protein